MLATKDRSILRELADNYRSVSELPIQHERRFFWREVNALRGSRPAVVIHVGMWNMWCKEMFGESNLRCSDPFFRNYEQWLRFQLFVANCGDDTIQEPWITVHAHHNGDDGNLWGFENDNIMPTEAGGARKMLAQLHSWDQLEQLRVIPHYVDVENANREAERLSQVIGDLLPVNIEYGSVYSCFNADISSGLAQLRGIEQMMVDMYESPDELHQLLSFMRDGILQAQQEAEDAGHFSLTSQVNQAMCYCDGWEDPSANAGSRLRQQLWGFFASQEFTLISPDMFDEFCLQYQLPIMEKWGLVAYGCCEDLTHKISMLRQLTNLRRIAVPPVADIAKCAEEISTDYLFSWHPNPTDVICCGFDEAKIHRIIGEGLRASKGCHRQIILKDVETLEGEPQRLRRWVELVHDEIAAVG